MLASMLTPIFALNLKYPLEQKTVKIPPKKNPGGRSVGTRVGYRFQDDRLARTGEGQVSEKMPVETHNHWSVSLHLIKNSHKCFKKNFRPPYFITGKRHHTPTIPTIRLHPTSLVKAKSTQTRLRPAHLKVHSAKVGPREVAALEVRIVEDCAGHVDFRQVLAWGNGDSFLGDGFTGNGQSHRSTFHNVYPWLHNIFTTSNNFVTTPTSSTSTMLHMVPQYYHTFLNVFTIFDNCIPNVAQLLSQHTMISTLNCFLTTLLWGSQRFQCSSNYFHSVP